MLYFAVKAGYFPISNSARKSYGYAFRKSLEGEISRIINTICDTLAALSTFRLVVWAFNHGRTKTLLTISNAASAEIIVLSASIGIKEEAPFQLPLFASAHISSSPTFAFAGAAFTGVFSALASLSLSIMDDLPDFSDNGSSFLPLLIIPSIMP